MKTFLRLSLCFLLICFALSDSEAQKRKTIGKTAVRKKSKSSFENSQWWLGAKFGATLTQAEPTQRFSVFSPTFGNTANNYFKIYEDYKKVGFMSGMVITYFYKGFSLSFQPNYGRQRFLYTNQYQWSDSENPNNLLQLNYMQDHRLDYIEFPLSLKYDILQTNLRPFVQLGGYYGTLINASKNLTIDGIDLASGGQNILETDEIITGADDLFIKSSWGIMGGIGVNWDLGNVRLSLDVSYRYGLHNITNAENRYTENRLSSVGDALDDVELRNIQTSFHILFPMKFLEKKSYKAVD